MMENGLERLNRLPQVEAIRALLRCCGSRTWAVQIAGQRPFDTVPTLRRLCKDVWWSLSDKDWLEAFDAHPRIGDRRAATDDGNGEHWAGGEQAKALEAGEDVLEQLAEANHVYADRFGFIFIICATDKSAEAVLENLKSRIRNDPDVEIRLAAEQQMQITEIRLEKLLTELEGHG